MLYGLAVYHLASAATHDIALVNIERSLQLALTNSREGGPGELDQVQGKSGVVGLWRRCKVWSRR